MGLRTISSIQVYKHIFALKIHLLTCPTCYKILRFFCEKSVGKTPLSRQVQSNRAANLHKHLKNEATLNSMMSFKKQLRGGETAGKPQENPPSRTPINILTAFERAQFFSWNRADETNDRSDVDRHYRNTDGAKSALAKVLTGQTPTPEEAEAFSRFARDASLGHFHRPRHWPDESDAIKTIEKYAVIAETLSKE